jgi:hypothetical protein
MYGVTYYASHYFINGVQQIGVPPQSLLLFDGIGGLNLQRIQIAKGKEPGSHAAKGL